MKHKRIVIGWVVILLAFFIVSHAYAGSYAVPKLSNVYTNANGRIAIKWSGSPSPDLCGTPNYGWVVVEATADNALKSFVYMLYTSGAPVTVTTSGCSGNNEIVNGIYTPGG